MLTNEMRTVLGCVVPEKILKDAKKELAPGTYLVDALVRVQGTLDKGVDFDMKVAAKVDWKLLASLALSKLNNETQDKVIENFIAALDGDETQTEALTKGVKERVEGKIEAVKGAAPTVKANGRVTAKLVAEVVGDAKVEFHQK